MDDKYERPTPINFKLDNVLTRVEGIKSEDKYDWSLIRTEYINDRTTTLKMLCEKYGCAEPTIRARSSKENWVIDRARVNQEFVKVATTENLRRQAKAAISFNASCLDVASKIVMLSNKRIDEAIENGEGIESNELGHIARAVKQAQEAGRLALGLPTNSSELTGKDGKPLIDSGDRTLEDINAELISLMGEDAFNSLRGGKQ